MTQRPKYLKVKHESIILDSAGSIMAPESYKTVSVMQDNLPGFAGTRHTISNRVIGQHDVRVESMFSRFRLEAPAPNPVQNHTTQNIPQSGGIPPISSFPINSPSSSFNARRERRIPVQRSKRKCLPQKSASSMYRSKRELPSMTRVSDMMSVERHKNRPSPTIQAEISGSRNHHERSETELVRRISWFCESATTSSGRKLYTSVHAPIYSSSQSASHESRFRLVLGRPAAYSTDIMDSTRRPRDDGQSKFLQVSGNHCSLYPETSLHISIQNSTYPVNFPLSPAKWPSVQDEDDRMDYIDAVAETHSAYATDAY
ncbi:hypothetical protein ABKN59_003993 [Abortiporus biennis]